MAICVPYPNLGYYCGQTVRSAHRNLQTLVKCITLRRTKNSEVNGHPLVSLPEKTVFVEQVELSQAEREEYELARKEGRSTIGRWVWRTFMCMHV